MKNYSCGTRVPKKNNKDKHTHGKKQNKGKRQKSKNKSGLSDKKKKKKREKIDQHELPQSRPSCLRASNL